MTDKVQKIRAFLVGIADADGVSTVLARAIEKKILPYIDSLQNEPVSEDLEEAANSCSSCIYLEEVLSDDDKEVLKERLVNTFKAGALWQKEQIIHNFKR